ncbi:MAG: F0F1 ATP synthase subunit alpha [Alphaproteobacteria bacterium]|nr:F0F1 ATP synthase subunit alpha [Alphaproteobacteria bacterium]
MIDTEKTFAAIDKSIKKTNAKIQQEEISLVQSVAAGTALVGGLENAQMDELLIFPHNVQGVVQILDKDSVGVVFLDNADTIRAGDKVKRSGRVIDVAVGFELLGRVINPLGAPLDDKGPIISSNRRPIEVEARAIMDRAPVDVPLQTGIKAVDAFTPIGRGQRELILGDRQTGKTAIALDMMLNQKDSGVICIYCAIGQRTAAVAQVIADLEKYGVLAQTVVVVAAGNDTAGMQYVAPYAATSIGEYFMEQGRDVLIVYDDLTNHARAYRQMSLLLRRPPGREAFPGDVFYIHSRLLERSTRLKPEFGGGSLTAIPIVATEAGNISAYIPTNIISITDGQIYLSAPLFQKGLMPAIDTGRSVSRVGGDAQLPAYKQLVGPLKLFYSQFEELEAFTKFGTQLDAATQARIKRGQAIRQVLTQQQYHTMSAADQIAVFMATNAGLFDGFDAKQCDKAQKIILEIWHAGFGDVINNINHKQKIAAEKSAEIIAAFAQALKNEGLS